MTRPAWSMIVILTVLLLPGCSHIEGYVDITKRDTLSRDYLDVFNRWTQEETIYAQFETRAHIAATKKSREFNRAYLAEYARIYLLGDGEREQREQVIDSESSKMTEFVFYAYTPDKESNDFSEEQSIWKIFLMDHRGERMEAVDIRRIKEITPVIRKLFPYVNPYYGRFYSVRFPRETDRCTLIFASILGRVEFVWGAAG